MIRFEKLKTGHSIEKPSLSFISYFINLILYKRSSILPVCFMDRGASDFRTIIAPRYLIMFPSMSFQMLSLVRDLSGKITLGEKAHYFYSVRYFQILWCFTQIYSILKSRTDVYISMLVYKARQYGRFASKT